MNYDNIQRTSSMTLGDTGNVPYRLSVLETVFPDNRALAAKAKRLEDSHQIIRLKRGMYVTDSSVSGVRLNEFLIANHLYGPSYVSMQTALRYYGLIPETVTVTISVTLGTARVFTNKIGVFRYIHCSDNYFPVGITSVSDGNATFMIASPEKALCDMIMFTPNLNLRYKAEIRSYLEDDLRIDLDDMRCLDIEILRRCAAIGRKKRMINQLIKIIEDERNI